MGICLVHTARDGDGHPETTALTGSALHINGSVVQGHQLLHQGKANARRGLQQVAATAQGLEPQEERLQLVGGNAYTLVLHGDDHVTSLPSYGQPDALIRQRVLEGVGEQVEDDGLHLLAVHPPIEFTLRSVDGVADVLLVRHGLEVLAHLCEERDEFGLLHEQFHLVVLYLTEVQYLVHQAQHALGVLIDEGEVLAHEGRDALVLEHLADGTGYQRERGAQFVGHVGEEPQLDVGEFLLHVHLMAQAVDVEEDVGGDAGYEQQQSQIDKPGPRCLPEGGEDSDGEGAHIVHPHTVAVGGLHLQAIVAGRQVEVVGHASVVVVVPLILQSFETIGVLDVLRMGIVEGGKAYAEVPLGGAQRELLQFVGIGRESLAVHPQFGKHHGRHIVALHHLPGVDTHHAGVRGEHQMVVSIQGRQRLGEVHPLVEKVEIEVAEGSRLGGELCEGFLRHNPQSALRVFYHTQHEGGLQPVLLVIVAKLDAVAQQIVRQHLVHAEGVGEQIDVACRGLEDVHNVVARQGGLHGVVLYVVVELHLLGVGEVGREGDEAKGGAHEYGAAAGLHHATDSVAVLRWIATEGIVVVDEAYVARLGIQQVEPLAVATYPEAVVAVGDDGVDVVAAQTIGVVRLVDEALHLVAAAVTAAGCQAEKSTTACAQPEGAVLLLADGVYVLLERRDGCTDVPVRSKVA